MTHLPREEFLCPSCGKAKLKKYLDYDDSDCIVIFECPECSAKGYGANYSDAYHNLQAQEWILGFSDAVEETISILKRIANSLEKISNKNNNTQED